MLPVLIGAALIGTGLQIYGQVKQGQAQSEAAEQNAALKRTQANELLARQAINERLMREEAGFATLQHGAAFAGTGREGAGIGGMLRIKSDVERSIANSRRDAEFKAKMLRMGGDADMQLASDSAAAGWIGGAGALLGSAEKIYGIADKYGSPKNSPKNMVWDGVAPSHSTVLG